MAMKLLDRARMSVTGTPGAGNITLGAAATGYQTFQQAGINDGDSFPYSLVDGNNWEYGVATYASSGNQLSRAVSKTSAQNTTPLTLSSKTVISGCIRAEDIAQATQLDGLTDVSVTEGAGIDQNFLCWDEAKGAWIARQINYSDIQTPPTPYTLKVYNGNTVVEPTAVGISFENALSITTINHVVTVVLGTGGGGGSGIAVELNNVSVDSAAVSFNFEGFGVTTDGSHNVTIVPALYVEDNGSIVSSGSTVYGLNFINATSITFSSGVMTIELPTGGGGGSALTVSNNGSVVDSAATTLNFVNATSITTASHDVTITLPTGGGGGGGVLNPPYYEMGPFAPPTPGWFTITNCSGSIGSASSVANKGMRAKASGSTSGGKTLFMRDPSGWGSSWAVTMRAVLEVASGQYPEIGLSVTDGTKIVTCVMQDNGAGAYFDVQHWANVNTYGSTQCSIALTVPVTWFRIRYDGTNFYFGYSTNGEVWNEYQESKTNYLSAFTGVGINLGASTNVSTVTINPSSWGGLVTYYDDPDHPYTDHQTFTSQPTGLFNQIMSPKPTMSGTGLTNLYNQGSYTIDDTAVGIGINSNTAPGGSNVVGVYGAAPATPYKITALISTVAFSAPYAGVGIGWTDAAGKLLLFSLLVNGTFELEKWSAPGTNPGSDASLASTNCSHNLMWMQIEDDGTNIKCRFSMDGVTWVNIFSEAKSAGYLAGTNYDHVMFFNQAQGGIIASTLLSWTVS